MIVSCDTKELLRWWNGLKQNQSDHHDNLVPPNTARVTFGDSKQMMEAIKQCPACGCQIELRAPVSNKKPLCKATLYNLITSTIQKIRVCFHKRMMQPNDPKLSHAGTATSANPRLPGKLKA